MADVFEKESVEKGDGVTGLLPKCHVSRLKLNSGTPTVVKGDIATEATPGPMQIDMELNVIQSDDSYTHIALVGKLDVGGVGEIENKFLGFTAARKKTAIVDLYGVTFLGSMGLRIFLDAAKSLAREQKKLILVGPQPLVGEVLEASGIGDLIAIETDPAAAVALAKS